MIQKQLTKLMIVVMACLVWPAICFAQGFDGSRNLVCSVVEVVECAPGDGCIEGTARNFNFPEFIRIDFENKQLIGKSQNQRVLTSPVDTVNTVDGNLILHGSQNGRAWSMVISQATGRYTGTVAADGFSFSIFGACIVP